jgi:threonine aldolase
MIVGSEKDINEARNMRKMLGGTLRQSGVLTACAIVSLTDWQEKLAIDNANAHWVAQ